MASLAEFSLPARGFPLGRIFDSKPEVTLELDRVVPSGDTVMPYFWVYAPDGDLETVLAVFEELPELRSIVLMDDLGDRGLFRAEWRPDYLGIMSAIAAAGVTVVAASGSNRGWLFELRSTAAGQLSAFQSYCNDHNIDVELTRLSRVSAASTDADFGLTPEQLEALSLAYREGYYADPRETDLEALAAKLGISRQAFAARLRRGYENLLGSTVVTDRSTEP